MLAVLQVLHALGFLLTPGRNGTLRRRLHLFLFLDLLHCLCGVFCQPIEQLRERHLKQLRDAEQGRDVQAAAALGLTLPSERVAHSRTGFGLSSGWG